MVQINFGRKEINCKIVYYGPGLSGKTTNLEKVHEIAPDDSKGELTSISTDGDRTLFFDFMPLDLGTVAGMRTKFHIYTVPGQVYYNSTRKLVLLGADGVIFVADSSPSATEANQQSLDNLKENLLEMGKDIAKMPLVLQYNKRDLPDAKDVPTMDKELNTYEVPSFEAVASKGDGVIQTLKAISSLVLESINSNERTGTLSNAPATSITPDSQDKAPAPQAQAPTPEPAPAAAAATADMGSAAQGSAPTPSTGGQDMSQQIERNYIPTAPQPGQQDPSWQQEVPAAAASQQGPAAGDAVQGGAPGLPSQAQELEQMGMEYQPSSGTATATLPQQPPVQVQQAPPQQQAVPKPVQPVSQPEQVKTAIPNQKAAIQQNKMNAVLRDKTGSENKPAMAKSTTSSRGIQVIGGKPKSKKKSNSMGLIVAVIVILLLAGAGAAYFLMM